MLGAAIEPLVRYGGLENHYGRPDKSPLASIEHEIRTYRDVWVPVGTYSVSRLLANLKFANAVATAAIRISRETAKST